MKRKVFAVLLAGAMVLLPAEAQEMTRAATKVQRETAIH